MGLRFLEHLLIQRFHISLRTRIAHVQVAPALDAFSRRARIELGAVVLVTQGHVHFVTPFVIP